MFSTADVSQDMWFSTNVLHSCVALKVNNNPAMQSRYRNQAYTAR